MFSLEYCEIFQNTYFEEHLQTAASSGKTYSRPNHKITSFALVLRGMKNPKKDKSSKPLEILVKITPLCNIFKSYFAFHKTSLLVH